MKNKQKINFNNLIESIMDDVFTKLLENRQNTISVDEIQNSIKRLPNLLRNEFPNISYVTIRAGKEILPFTLIKIWQIHPEIYKHGDSFSFGLHLGNAFEEKLPSENEIKEVIDYIKQYMKNRGWFVFSWSLSGRGETLQIEIMPEKTDQLKDVPNVLYHLTDTINIPSIEKKGLKPKASSKQERTYTNRVYLFSDEELLKQQIQQNIEAHKENGGGWNPTLTKTLDMSVVVIDAEKLKKGTKLYRDPEFGGTMGAYYTFTEIPKEAISQIKKI